VCREKKGNEEEEEEILYPSEVSLINQQNMFMPLETLSKENKVASKYAF
jgi:hypothetical protein